MVIFLKYVGLKTA